MEFGVRKYDKDTYLLVCRQYFHGWSSSIEQRRNYKKWSKSCWVSLKIGKVWGKKRPRTTMEMCELLTLRHVFDAVWNIQPSPEASSARFYLELWRHRERERERLDNAEACYLYFSFHTASSVYSCSIKEANISLSGSYAHSNHEYCFYTLIVRVIFEAVSSTVIKEITLVAPGGGELVLLRPKWLRRRLEPLWTFELNLEWLLLDMG